MLRDHAAPPVARVRALEQAWSEAEGGERDRAPTRAVLKDLVWDGNTPEQVRLPALQTLLDDTSPEGQADSRRMAILMLPTERDRTATALLSAAAARHGWTDATAALVRSYARPLEGIPDADRPEREALRRLHPGRDLAEIVYGVFVDPQTDPGPGDLRLDERARLDAWELLSRLHETRGRREELLRAALPEDAGADARRLRSVLLATFDQFGVLPSRAAETRWAASLAEQGSPAAQRWWREAGEAASRLGPGQREGLELRHVEPVRWAAEHRPQWLDASAAELESQLRGRLEGREHVRRTAENAPTRKDATEKLGDWIDELVWGDLLSILVLDEAVRSEAVVRSVAEYARLDRADRATEYGGLIEVAPEGDGFRAVLFQPRTRDRGNDYRFVASDDMIRYSDRALAHFHMHVQRDNNRRIAGPSPGDLAYTAWSGRNCIVFTSVREGQMNVDYYQPNGAVIDLGLIGG